MFGIQCMSKVHSLIAWLGIALALAPLLYLVSYGPANSLVRSGVLNPRRVDAFYSLIPEKLRYDIILVVWKKIDTRQGVGER